ncbi:alpha/beta fold hydrolase [Agromyces sp. CFH 90414]|uniref:Alpha/beta fold hydrolase n=1 Tax=Agromyces agglutinans TaxID=2662258 RepID=A0A6I2FGS6_9MICO|nr:alpha/beta hydrolase [Agromyces agglutinans]MRG60108.1 alpha/beta fold hydrolase [Agromyces agglutinans]
MDVILIPGFWLDASSWRQVMPVLEETGHRLHPVTLPGLESVDADRSGIGLADHIAAVVALVDHLDGPVVLVGHSGGGAVAHGVVDARPDRIAKVIYVDAGPLGDGQSINDELPVVDGEVPLPDWSVFEEADLVDLDDDLRAAFRARAIPEPAAVTSDPIRLTDERRYDVPITVIACEFPSSLLVESIAAGAPWVAELARVKQVDYVDLPTGHWPQFTKPVQLGQAIAAALPVA